MLAVARAAAQLLTGSGPVADTGCPPCSVRGAVQAGARPPIGTRLKASALPPAFTARTDYP